jgi:DNA polymerase-3 subunit alpha
MVHEGRMKLADSVLGKSFIIAGIVVTSEQKYTQNQRPWVIFNLEDFNASAEFRLYGKDYEAYMKYTQVNMPLLIKCSVKQRFKGKDSTAAPSYELKIVGMMLLSNIKDEFVKEFCIDLPLERISDDLTKSLRKVCRKHKGNARLKFNIIDRESDMAVEFFSKKILVSPDQELFDYLQNKGLGWRVIKGDL